VSARATAHELAATLAAFVDTLLPGDDLFPPASAAGTHGLLAERIRQHFGSDGIARLVADLAAGGVPLLDAAPERRVEAVRRLEREQPDDFAFLRMAAYLAYYQTPPVIDAIRALGYDYHDAPQPRGYSMPAFDVTPGVNVPTNPRGSFKATESIERIDVSTLADLNLPVQED
jgi:hypothetical protein